MSKLTEPAFKAGDFIGTQSTNSLEKAKFANHLLRFIDKGFPETLFHRQFYQRLSCCFRHIAHYDRMGFYTTWFSDERKRYNWVINALQYGCFGQPEYTFCDVERAIQERLKRDGVLLQLGAILAKSEEDRMRAQYETLKQRFEPKARVRTRPHPEA